MLYSKKLELPLSEKNFLLLFIFGGFLMLVLFFFSFKTQVLQGYYYKEKATDNQFVVYKFSAQRGIIYDRNNQQLVYNETGFDLWNNASSTIEKENLTHEELVFFEANPNTEFSVVKKTRRSYNITPGLCHLLGYIGRVSESDLEKDASYLPSDYIGKEGIERIYESVLKEQKGEILIERTAQGKEISRQVSKEPQSGGGIVLSLDLPLQQKVAEAFIALKANGIEKGAVIALQPQTGEVLALFSSPFFDNNLFSSPISQADWQALNQDKNKPQLNRSIAGLYPTGSAIKPFVAYAGLEEGVITEKTTLYCPKQLCIPNKYTDEATCFEDWAFHGYTDVKRALAESVNPFFYMTAGGYVAPKKSSPYYDSRLPNNFVGLGAMKLGEYLSMFGFGTTTGIDLPGEVAGRVPTPQWKQDYFKTIEQQQWYLGDTYNLSIGQGYLLATPLQLITYFLPIANKGTLYQPQLLKQVLSEKGDVVGSFDPVILKQDFLNQKNLDIVREGMRQAVVNSAGSSHSLNRLPVSSAAKTGTAQIFPVKEIYDNWVVVFAPYDNPEIVLLVLLEEVEGLQPLAQRTAFTILNWYFTR